MRTGDASDLKVMKQVLLEIYEAQKHLIDLQHNCTDDIAELKRSVAERAQMAAQKLDKVHSYLMHSFGKNWGIVLHKAQVLFTLFHLT